MSYRLLKQLAHGLALLVLQRWSIWLLLVVVVVVAMLVDKLMVAVVVLAVLEQAQDYL